MNDAAPNAATTTTTTTNSSDTAALRATVASLQKKVTEQEKDLNELRDQM